MKSKKTFILLVIALVLGAVFCLVPLASTPTVSVNIAANPQAIFRHLLVDSTWRHWWPEQPSSKELAVDGFTVKKGNILLNAMELTASKEGIDYPIVFQLVSKSDYEVEVIFRSSVDIPHSPLARIDALRQASKLKAMFTRLATALKNHYTPEENLYQIKIVEEVVPFPFVITTSRNAAERPTTAEVYAMIDQLTDYLKKTGSTSRFQPMLHVSEQGKNNYFIQVGIPIDEPLPDTELIKCKRFLKGGQILRSSINKTTVSITTAMKQMELYVQDHHLFQVAIPYQYLVTNRRQVPDSLEWKTDLYFPVIINHGKLN